MFLLYVFLCWLQSCPFCFSSFRRQGVGVERTTLRRQFTMWDLEITIQASLPAEPSPSPSWETAYRPLTCAQLLNGAVNRAASHLVTQWTATKGLPLQSTSQMAWGDYTPAATMTAAAATISASEGLAPVQPHQVTLVTGMSIIRKEASLPVAVLT